MNKQNYSVLISSLVIFVTTIIYLVLKQRVDIPRLLAVIIFVGLILLSIYFVYFSNKGEEKKDEDVVIKSYEIFM